MRTPAQWLTRVGLLMLLGYVLLYWSVMPTYAGGGGSKICIRQPRNEPIGYPCRFDPCSGNCRWFIQPNGDCFQGDKTCTEADGVYEVETFYTPCVIMNFPWNPTCGCNFNNVFVGPRMRYSLDDCSA